MLTILNESVDPCDDFYEFACGHFMSMTSSIPNYQEYIDNFGNIEDRIYRQVLSLLTDPVQSNEPRPFSMAKSFFNTCMNVKKIDGRGSEPLMNVLFRLGDWPLIKGDRWKDKAKWTLSTYLSYIRQCGFEMEYLFTIGIDRDPKNMNESIIGVSDFAKNP